MAKKTFYENFCFATGGGGNITLNPYSVYNEGDPTQSGPELDGLAATRRLRDSVYMSPQLVQLTNTLRRPPPPPVGSQGKKICQAGSHSASDTCGQSHTQQPTHQGVNDSTMLPEKEVVFRAVSPHGHVYWEIDPTRGMNLFLQF